MKNIKFLVLLLMTLVHLLHLVNETDMLITVGLEVLPSVLVLLVLEKNAKH